MAPKKLVAPHLAKRFGRRRALQAVGLTLGGVALGPPPAGARPAAGAHGSARFRPLAAGSLPRRLSPAEFEALGALAETILPATDTPGAREAGVDFYLDDAAGAEPALLERLRAGLTRLDELSRAAFGRGFAGISDAERAGVLGPLARAGDPFFVLIRGRVVDAYYKSEAGLLGELGWTGHEFWDEFPGACPHGDPLHHPRPGGGGR